VTLRGLLIDLDGTLADSLAAMRRVYGAFLERYGFAGTDGEFEELNGPSLREIIATLNDRHCLDGSHEELLGQYQGLVEKAYAQSVAPRDGAAELLDASAGLKLVLVTSAPRCVAEGFLVSHGWSNRFDVIVAGDEVSASKPDPAIYRLALERVGLAPDEAIAIEDSDAGEASARGAGLRVWRADGGLTAVGERLEKERSVG